MIFSQSLRSNFRPTLHAVSAEWKKLLTASPVVRLTMRVVSNRL